MIEPWTTIMWNGRTYVRCPTCHRYGRDGWSHICGPSSTWNWYASPQELEEAEARSQQEIMKMVGTFVSTAHKEGR
jgi:hypothetical protein